MNETQHSGVSGGGCADPSSKQECIALLAYRYWQERGCPEGSPEEDWLRAESEIKESSVPKELSTTTGNQAALSASAG